MKRGECDKICCAFQSFPSEAEFAARYNLSEYVVFIFVLYPLIFDWKVATTGLPRLDLPFAVDTCCSSIRITTGFDCNIIDIYVDM